MISRWSRKQACPHTFKLDKDSRPTAVIQAVCTICHYGLKPDISYTSERRLFGFCTRMSALRDISAIRALSGNGRSQPTEDIGWLYSFQLVVQRMARVSRLGLSSKKSALDMLS